jgi:hypothetical protein
MGFEITTFLTAAYTKGQPQKFFQFLYNAIWKNEEFYSEEIVSYFKANENDNYRVYYAIVTWLSGIRLPEPDPVEEPPQINLSESDTRPPNEYFKSKFNIILNEQQVYDLQQAWQLRQKIAASLADDKEQG